RDEWRTARQRSGTDAFHARAAPAAGRAVLVSRAMRVAGALLLGAVILLTTATPAAAAVVRQGETVTVGPDETIEDDLYAFAANVNIAGTVRGDVIAAGANFSVDGTVTGNLMAAGS